ncbi:hypothetical protein [Angustibacter aerolatus]
MPAKQLRVDEPTVRRRLQRAARKHTLVRVRRWTPESDRITGYVVGVGSAWFVLAVQTDGSRPDGWIALRVRDVSSVRVRSRGDTIDEKSLRARGEWPPAPPHHLELDGVRGVLRTASRSAPLVTVLVEWDEPDRCWIGAVERIGKRVLSLREVDPGGRWKRHRSKFDLEDVTRVDWGDAYNEALLLVAGPPPR